MAGIFADIEQRDSDNKVKYLNLMQYVIQDVYTYDNVDASLPNSETAKWLRKFFHGFRTADGDDFEQKHKKFELLQRLGLVREDRYKGFGIKNFNLWELDFDEKSDMGKRFSRAVVDYMKQHRGQGEAIFEIDGIRYYRMGDYFVLINDEKYRGLFVGPSGAVLHVFSAKDWIQKQAFLAKRIIEDTKNNLDLVAWGEITDFHQRIDILSRAYKMIRPVLYKNDTCVFDSGAASYFSKKPLEASYDDVMSILSPDVAQFFNERYAETTDGLKYTNQIIGLIVDTIQNASQEYKSDILNEFFGDSMQRIPYRLTGQDKFIEAFTNNPALCPRLSVIRDLSETLLMVSELKLKEHIEKGGNFDNFEQPFKQLLHRTLYGDGFFETWLGLFRGKKLSSQDFQDLRYHKKSLEELTWLDDKERELCAAYFDYGNLSMDSGNNNLNFYSVGTSVARTAASLGDLLEQAKDRRISPDEQKQIEARRERLLSILDKEKKYMLGRFNKELDSGNTDIYNDIFYFTLHNDVIAPGLLYSGDFYKSSIISNCDFEPAILRIMEKTDKYGVRSCLLSMGHVLETYNIEHGKVSEQDAHKNAIYPSLAAVFRRDDLSLVDKIESFGMMANGDFFASDYKGYYEILIGANGRGGLLAEIDKLSDLSLKYKCYLILLNKEVRISDPEIRTAVIKKAAQCFWQLNGSYNDITQQASDSNGAKIPGVNREFIKSKIEEFKQQYIPELDKTEFLKELSELMLSQKDLSLAMKPNDIDFKTTDKKTIAAMYGLDVIAYILQEYPETKTNLQEFLLGDGTLQQASELVKSIYVAICTEYDKYKQDNKDKILDRYLRGEDVTAEIRTRFPQINKLSPQYCVHFKKEFDAAPLEAKAVIINELITNGGANWEYAFQTAADKLFADTDDMGDIGRDFLYSYIAARPGSERTTYLAAMMAAANNKAKAAQNYVNSPYTLAQRNLARGLRMFLENSGPAGTKLAQAMASYSDVPEFIRVEMQLAKSEANPPTRWEIFSYKDKTMEELLSYGPLGKRRGSASFFVTYDLGDKIVKIMRPGAQIEANKEFEIYKAMLEKLSKKYNNLMSFERLIQNAANNVHVETDLGIGEEQYVYAKENMYPNTVTANNVTFEIRVMDWVKHDKDWAIMDKAQGVDFKNLTEPYKTAVAKAVFSTEIANILSGKRFDSDRHAGQYKFDTKNNVIGVFDTGSISIVEPTEKERRALGLLLARTILGMRENNDVGAVLSAEIDKLTNELYSKEISEKESVPPYLSEFQRGMLALHDFYAPLSIKDILECLVGALNNGKNKIHPQIVNGFVSGLTVGAKHSDFQIKDFLNVDEEPDALSPEDRTNRRIGKLLFNGIFESVNGTKSTFSQKFREKTLALRLDKKACLQIAKGAVRGAYGKLNPYNYSVQDRKELGVFLYHVCKADVDKDASLETIISRVTSKMVGAGEYVKNLIKIISIMSKIPELSGDKIQKAAAFVTIADKDVAEGFKYALNNDNDKSLSLAKRMKLKLIPISRYIPKDAKKLLFNVISTQFISNYISRQFGGVDIMKTMKDITNSAA